MRRKNDFGFIYQKKMDISLPDKGLNAVRNHACNGLQWESLKLNSVATL